jgi:hypothetical protein
MLNHKAHEESRRGVGGENENLLSSFVSFVVKGFGGKHAGQSIAGGAGKVM